MLAIAICESVNFYLCEKGIRHKDEDGKEGLARAAKSETDVKILN